MTMLATSTVSAAPAPVFFTGRNGDFRRLVVRGALLELVTFGFYRFWLTTDIRRHLWSHTEIAGDALEYTGRARELLFGFLIALAVLGPIFLAYFLIGLEAERIKAFASLPLYLFLLAFGQFAAYRARRYRLTRTVWRGVRFWMTGSGWSYAWRSMLWGLLLVPSIGLAYPWRTAALERFKLRHTLYGNLPGRLEATGGQLFGRIWWIWLLGLLPFLLLAGGLVAILVTVGTRPQPSAASHPPGAAIIAIVLGTFLLIAFAVSARHPTGSGVALVGRRHPVRQPNRHMRFAVRQPHRRLLGADRVQRAGVFRFRGGRQRADGRAGCRYACPRAGVVRAVPDMGDGGLCGYLSAAGRRFGGAGADLHATAGLAAGGPRVRGNQHRGCRRRYRRRRAGQRVW